MSKIVFNSLNEINNVLSQLSPSLRRQDSGLSATEVEGGKYELTVPDGLESVVTKANPKVQYPDFVQPEITKVQFARALWKKGIITFEETRSFVKTGDIPAAFEPALDQMPEENKQEATLALEGLSTFNAESPIIRDISEKMGWSWTDTIELWNLASTL